MKRRMPTTEEVVEALKKGFILEPHINDPPYKYVVEEMRKQEKKGKEKRDEDAQDTR